MSLSWLKNDKVYNKNILGQQKGYKFRIQTLRLLLKSHQVTYASTKFKIMQRLQNFMLFAQM